MSTETDPKEIARRGYTEGKPRSRDVDNTIAVHITKPANPGPYKYTADKTRPAPKE